MAAGALLKGLKCSMWPAVTCRISGARQLSPTLHSASLQLWHLEFVPGADPPRVSGSQMRKGYS